MFVKDLLKDKIAVVTGGGSGLGKACALEFAAHGAAVVLASRNAERLEAEAAALRARGARALAVPTDVTDDRQVRALFEKVDAEFGRVDILVNGAAANFIRPSEALTPVRWRKVIDIVLNGSFYCALEAGKRMIAQGSGSIVSLVAAYGWTGAPGLAPSAAAKAGVCTLTKTLGVEWARHGVRVNAVCPGFIDTPQSRERLWPEEWIREELLAQVPTKRFGTEKDVTDAVLYVVSPMAGYVNGEIFVVDGGESLGKGALKVIERGGAIRRARDKAPAR